MFEDIKDDRIAYEGQDWKFGGIPFKGPKEIGRGSNAICYCGELNKQEVIIKEFYPIAPVCGIKFRRAEKTQRFIKALSAEGEMKISEDQISSIESTLADRLRKHECEMQTWCAESKNRVVSKAEIIDKIVPDDPGTIRVFMKTEYFKGAVNLFELKRDNKLTKYDICRCIIGLTRTILEVHKLGVLHLDISPKNVLYIRETGDVHLVDFGSAQKRPVKDDNLESFSSTGGYSSPEQIRVREYISYQHLVEPDEYKADLKVLLERISFQSDYFSIGALLFFLLTGEVFDEDLFSDSGEYLESIQKLPSEFVPFLLKTLKENPEERYEGWGRREIINIEETDIFKAANNLYREVEANNEKVRREEKKRKIVHWVAGAAFVAVLVAIILSIWARSDIPRLQPKAEMVEVFENGKYIGEEEVQYLPNTDVWSRPNRIISEARKRPAGNVQYEFVDIEKGNYIYNEEVLLYQQKKIIDDQGNEFYYLYSYMTDDIEQLPKYDRAVKIMAFKDGGTLWDLYKRDADIIEPYWSEPKTLISHRSLLSTDDIKYKTLGIAYGLANSEGDYEITYTYEYSEKIFSDDLRGLEKDIDGQHYVFMNVIYSNTLLCDTDEYCYELLQSAENIFVYMVYKQVLAETIEDIENMNY